MLLRAAVLLATAAGQAGSPSAPPAPSRPSLGDLPPEGRVPGLAVMSFNAGCLERFGASASRSDYARGSDELGVEMARDVATLGVGDAVRLDGRAAMAAGSATPDRRRRWSGAPCSPASMR